MTDAPFNGLFLCTGDSARSIVAEAIMNRVGPPKFKAHSAGSMPKGVVHPPTLKLPKRKNFVVEDVGSKSWEEFAGAGRTAGAPAIAS